MTDKEVVDVDLTKKEKQFMTENKNELLRVSTSDGKYEVVQEASGEVSAYRNGEYFYDMTGQKIILQLAYDLSDARLEIERLKTIIEKADKDYIANSGDEDIIRVSDN
jgi:hypothetical protein